MKRKLFYGTLLCAAIVSSVFYACKKGTDPAAPISPAGALNQSARLATETTVAYSKDENNVVYKMSLRGDADGNMTVDRSIYVTTRPDTISRLTFIETGIPRTGLTMVNDTMRGDSLVVARPVEGSRDRYFYIPFQPGSETVTLHPVLGGNGLLYDCAPMFCPKNSICDLMQWGTGYFCGSTSCNSCWTAVKMVPGPYSPGIIISNAGSVLIIASSLHVTN